MSDDFGLSINILKRRKSDGCVAGFAEVATMHERETLAAFVGHGFQDVVLERIEQIEEHGFDLQHDLGHHPGELALGAASYLNTAIDQLYGRHHAPKDSPDTWPWQREAWRPGTARDNLVKALAIGLSVLDRLDNARRDAGDVS